MTTEVSTETVTVTIDGKDVTVPKGTSVLNAARQAGIDIPTLCAHPDLPTAGVCRMCVVEVEGQRGLQASCATPIERATEISTNSDGVRKARKEILELMLSKHLAECDKCACDGECELQNLAHEYDCNWSRFGSKTERTTPIDDFGPSIVRDPDKCIECLRCVQTCIELQGIGALGVLGRGDKTEVGTYLDMALFDVNCINCGQCINRCPTGALTARDNSDDVRDLINDPTKHVVIQTAPAPRAGIGEEFGLEPGTPLTWQMNTALREIGFDKVFDTNFTADLTIIEEGTELLLRLYKNLVQGDSSQPVPQFTSCSPGWIKYIEHQYPEYLPNLSTCKSPQQMFGALIKTWYAEKNSIDPKDVVSVSLMPCTAKKFEAARPEMDDSGFMDVDYSLTTRELAKLIRDKGLSLPELEKSDFDDPFGTASGSGVIFGATGGVMEAALRTVVELVLGIKVEDLFEHADIIPLRGFDGVKYVEITIPDEVGPVPAILANLVPDWDWLKGATLKVAVAHGTANAMKVMDDIKAGGKLSECHFIEFMACPGGCLGGGGQPIPTSPEIRAKRAEAIYAEDTSYGDEGRARKSHENPPVMKLYEEFLTDGPGGHKSHKLLHTDYTARGTFIATGDNAKGK